MKRFWQVGVGFLSFASEDELHGRRYLLIGGYLRYEVGNE